MVQHDFPEDTQLLAELAELQQAFDDEFSKRLKLAAEFDRLERKLRRVTRILEDLLWEIW
jgi:hypothetical protein